MPRDLEKTILVTSMSASMAHVVRPLEIAKVLRDLGYRVVFAGSGKPTMLVQQVGFELRYLPEWDLPELLNKLKNGSNDIHPLKQVEDWVEAELSLYENLNPVIVLDDARVTSHISAMVAGLPRIAIQNAYTHPNAVRGFHDPTLIGPRSVMEPGDERSYNIVRRRYGLSPMKRLHEALEADLNLFCDVPEYAPLHTIPPAYHYVGPIIWGQDLIKPHWLKQLDPSKPTIYLTMGSTGPKGAFQAAIDQLSGNNYQVMMTLGSLVNKMDLGPLPEGFYSAHYASGDALARRADVIICHAGNGTAYQGLRSGVPLISWPSMKDQHWNARRLSELGVSIKISSPDELSGAVKEILNSTNYKREAVRFRDIILQYNGPERAASLIHNFIKNL